MRSSNPALAPALMETEPQYSYPGAPEPPRHDQPTASYHGVGLKTLAVLAVGVVAAWYMWPLLQDNPGIILPGILVSAAVAIGAMFLARRSPSAAPFAAIVFGVAEGVVLAAIIGAIGTQYGSGIVFQAVLITAFVFVAMLTLYTTGIIKVTRKYRTIVLGATLGAGLFYLVTVVAAMFGFQMPLVFDSGPLGIAFTALMCVIAAAGLAVDFQAASHVVEGRGPTSAEWAVALGLVASIVWLYVEVLRLLAKLQSS